MQTGELQMLWGRFSSGLCNHILTWVRHFEVSDISSTPCFGDTVEPRPKPRYAGLDVARNKAHEQLLPHSALNLDFLSWRESDKRGHLA